MKQTKFIVLLFLFFGLTIHLSAQTSKQTLTAEEKENQELARKFQQGMQARRMEHLQSKTTIVQSNRYNNREAEIMTKLNTDGIPSDFPIYKPEYTNEQYTILINKWYAANPSLLKKENINEQK